MKNSFCINRWLREKLELPAVFPLRKFYAEQIFDLVSMNILMLSLNELPTFWTQFGNRWSRRSLIKNEQITFNSNSFFLFSWFSNVYTLFAESS